MPRSLLPPFTREGLLPPGDYPLTLEQLARSMLVLGPRPRPKGWDVAWRRHLVQQFEIPVRQLWQVGITEIFADGSLVTSKEHPGDIDGYFVCDKMEFATGRLQNRLRPLDPDPISPWNPWEYVPSLGKMRPLMWRKYHVELFPHYAGLSSGIPDELGHPQEFPAAFRKTRITYRPKGIIRIIP